MAYAGSEYNEFNRFTNIDSIESKIINHLIYSHTLYAETIWRLLKYDDSRALCNNSTHTDVTEEERLELVEGFAEPSSGTTSNIRLYLTPFTDDAWTSQSSSVYIYVEDIYATNHLKSDVVVSVDTVTHSKINAIISDQENPNNTYYEDLDSPDAPTVKIKSRETTLVKCLIAELNGLYLDGIGYLQFNNFSSEGTTEKANSTFTMFNGRSYFGHKTKFNVNYAEVSEDSDIGY